MAFYGNAKGAGSAFEKLREITSDSVDINFLPVFIKNSFDEHPLFH